MIFYHPGLRFKLGEYTAASRLPIDIRKYVEPRFVLPCLTEPDPALGRVPTADEIAVLTGDRVGKHWPLGREFLDTNYIAPDLGDLGLLRLFRAVWGRNSNIIPVARLGDLSNPMFDVIRADGPTKLAIHVSDEEADASAIDEALKAAKLKPSECVIFVDFTGAPLDPEIAAGSVSGVLDRVGDAGQWQRVIFQGSNFPFKTALSPCETKFIPRHEWDVFQAASKECGVPLDRLGFGDFGADHGKMAFSRKKRGGRPHRQLRYTSLHSTMIVRGSDTGADTEVMRDVCKRIIESEHFSGQAFSEADDRIYCLAKGINPKPGSASSWREWNLLHHMVRVVRDLGLAAGITFAPGRSTHASDQESLFTSDEGV